MKKKYHTADIITETGNHVANVLTSLPNYLFAVISAGYFYILQERIKKKKDSNLAISICYRANVTRHSDLQIEESARMSVSSMTVLLNS